MVNASGLLLREYPVCDDGRLLLDACAENVLVSGLPQQLNVGLVQKSRVSYDDEILDLEPLDEVVYDGNHRTPLVLCAFEDGIRQRIAISTHQPQR